MANPTHTAFPETRWTTVERATSADPPTAFAGIEGLCQDYHAAITAWFGYATPWAGEAEDLAQSFLHDLLLESGRLSPVDRELGRFRSFLVARMRNHAIDRKRYDAALRRGGGVPHSDLADVSPPPTTGHASEFFDLSLVRLAHQRALELIRGKLKGAEAVRRFDVLAPCLVLPETDRNLGAAARQLGLKPGTARKALFDLRTQYLQAFTAEIRRLLGPDDPAGDLEYLVGLHARAVESGVLAAPPAALLG
jgi:DNA-directed RNA polymerase specialized sigma24 family protein